MPRGRKKKTEDIQSTAPEAIGHELTGQAHEALHAADIPHTHHHDHEDGHDHAHEDGHTHEHSRIHGHGHTHSHEHTRSVLNRMSRAIGHLQYVRKMMEEGRDCSEVLIQLAAVQSALQSTGKVILQDHLKHCMVEAAQVGDTEAIDELCKAIDRYMK
ncbi:MAG: metal-sensing transcriptional repressor [Clostridia bacterium]|nr:metal-sensing transcriptional repressor [Clostridia bacterium]